MSLFSFFRKNKQENASDEGAFHSRAEEESKAVRSRGKNSKSTRREPPADPVLPEKKRARRRLVGAIALVLAAVIGLPMLFDSEPKPLASDIAIEIPSRDERREEAAVASSEPVEVVPELASSDNSPAPNSPVVVAPVPVPAAPTPAPAPVAKPAPATVPVPEVKPKASAPAKTHETARALALIEGRAEPKEEKKSEKFVIQVAALSTKEKVEQLQAKLKGAGINSYTQQIATASGPHTRIRVGPFASREEAEKMRAKIMELGLNGKLVPA
jgi:DedD protein